MKRLLAVGGKRFAKLCGMLAHILLGKIGKICQTLDCVSFFISSKLTQKTRTDEKTAESWWFRKTGEGVSKIGVCAAVFHHN